MNQSNRSSTTDDKATLAPCPDREIDPDFELEIQSHLGAAARAAASLSAGVRLSEILIDLQRALADCDISPIDEVPTLAPVGVLAGTAGAYRISGDALVDPFTIEKSKVGTQFDIVRAIVDASVDRLRGDGGTIVKPFAAMIDELKDQALRLADEAYRLGLVDGQSLERSGDRP